MKEADAKSFVKIRNYIENYKLLNDEDKKELSMGHDILSLSVKERKNIISLLDLIGLKESFDKDDFKKVAKEFQVILHPDKINSFKDKFDNEVFDASDIEAAKNLFNILRPVIKCIDDWFNRNNGVFNLSNLLLESPFQDSSENRRDNQDSSMPSFDLDRTILTNDFLDDLSTKLINTEESKPKFSLLNLFTRCIYSNSLEKDVYSSEDIKNSVLKILIDYRKERYREGSKEDEIIIKATNLANGRLTKEEAKDIFNIIAARAILDNKLKPYFQKIFYDERGLNQDKIKFFVNSLFLCSGVAKPLYQTSSRAPRYNV
jgi:hypothetical protein